MFKINYTCPIDPHVHFRGEEYTHIKPSFLERGFLDAKEVGLVAVVEQPNPNPWLTTLERILSRLEHAKNYSGDTRHSIHMGLTTNKRQIKQALTEVIRGSLGLASDKIFYSGTTNTEDDSETILAIKDPELQRWIWEQKKLFQYTGVSIGHMEDENFFAHSTPFDPANPITHSLYQKEEAEVVQIDRQLGFAIDSDFKGIFYVPHVSTEDGINLLNKAKKRAPFKIIIETTGRHMLLNTNAYLTHGNRVKVNPPLRSPETQAAVLDRVLKGQTDIIGTDHAPHPLEAKDSQKPPSGFQEILAWPLIVKTLRNCGMSEGNIERLTFKTANDLFFRGSVTKRESIVEYKPDTWIERYGFNPFSTVDSTLEA